MVRRYVVDPVAANRRAMIISSMRTTMAGGPNYDLPSVATLRAGTNFVNIWNWSPSVSACPPTFNAGIWTAETTNDFLVIERVNYLSEYLSDVTVVSVGLNKLTGSAINPYYEIFAPGSATPRLSGTVVTSAVVLDVFRGELVRLYRGINSMAPLDVVYVVDRPGRSFTFSGTNWNSP
jgi:hypothetical protein